MKQREHHQQDRSAVRRGKKRQQEYAGYYRRWQHERDNEHHTLPAGQAVAQVTKWQETGAD